MSSHDPLTPYLLLSLADHQAPAQEQERHGGSVDRYARYLNTSGRWAVHGSAHAPLLVWKTARIEEAQAAAQQASEARKRTVVVVDRLNSDWKDGRDIEHYSPAFEAALLGAARQSEGRARRLRTEVEKLEAYSQVVLAAAAAPDADALAAVSHAAAKALQAKFGGGSITSAFAWLAGRTGRETLASVLGGEGSLSGPLSIADLVAAAELAEEVLVAGNQPKTL